MNNMQRVLILEDNETLNVSISRYFMKHGWQVASALTAKSALQQIEEFFPDLIAVDYMMHPHFDGVTFIEEFTKRFPDSNTKVIMCSYVYSKEVLLAAKRDNKPGFVSRPRELKELDNLSLAFVG